jgi:flagellar basal body L-ring protein FlgH
MLLRRMAAILILNALLPLLAAKATKPKTIQRETQADYIQRMQQLSPDVSPASVGSLWTDNGRFANIGADYKATHVCDLITIVVAQGTTAIDANVAPMQHTPRFTITNQNAMSSRIC